MGDDTEQHDRPSTGTDEQVCFIYRLLPGAGPEYDRLHAEIPDVIRQRIEARGAHDYSIFRRGDLVITVLRRGPRRAADDPATEADQAAWSASLRPLFEAINDADGNPLVAHQVFRLD
ncbi:L-rhamnose mutarotase [Propionibacteriaceae bacterium Y2011]|uniref:L-rhamnose mutarotase n=1 Tax=Microlunatus sp. Y2014 TaxID=3418488 RepID=UPI003B49927B